MPGYTSIFGLQYLTDQDPAYLIAAQTEQVVRKIEAVMKPRAANPNLDTLNAVVGSLNDTTTRVGVLEPKVTTLENRPAASLYATAVQSIPDNTWTPLALAGEAEDTHDGHSTTTNPSRWTCPPNWGGLYLVAGSVFLAQPGAVSLVAIYKNGQPVRGSLRRNYNSGTNDLGLDTQKLVRLVPGDYLEVAALHVSGGARNAYADSTYGSSLDLVWMRK